MPQRSDQGWRTAIGVLACLTAASCSSTDSQLRQHQEKLESLTNTTAAVATAWLDGHVSGTYGGTALEQTLVLVEQERTAIAKKPKMLADPRGARMSDAADWLSRQVAATIRELNAGDGEAVRQHLAELPHRSAEK